jgi:hypothetical protein
VRGGVGLGLDILTDPLTYVTFGAGGAAKTAAGKAARDATERAERRLVEATERATAAGRRMPSARELAEIAVERAEASRAAPRTLKVNVRTPFTRNKARLVAESRLAARAAESVIQPIRSGTLEERDRWMGDQEWFISTFLEPVFRAWLQMALLSGAVTMPNGSALPASKVEKFSKHEWQARRWDWVDPKADTEANILKVKAGLMAPQDLAAAMGYDFDDVLANIKAAQDLAKEYGVRLTAYDGLPGTQNLGVGDGQPANNLE